VIKKDGRRERFSREKIKIGILKACEKRNISESEIDKLVDKIECKLKNMDKTEIETKVIGELVMNELKKLDKVAYIRFASVYREFADIDSFMEELKKLTKRRR
jgi:transcriptional repressor NrdR